MKPILLIVRAPPGQCATCENYSTNISPLYTSHVRKDGRLEIINLTRDSKDSIYITNEPLKPVHPEIYQWVAWWPCFIIVTGESWKNHSSSLVGRIFGGTMTLKDGAKVPVEVAGEYNLKNEEALIKWTGNVLLELLSSRSGKKRISYQEYKQINDHRYGWGKESHEY